MSKYLKKDAAYQVISVNLDSDLCDCLDGEIDPLEELWAKIFSLTIFFETELMNFRELDLSKFLFM